MVPLVVREPLDPQVREGRRESNERELTCLSSQEQADLLVPLERKFSGCCVLAPSDLGPQTRSSWHAVNWNFVEYRELVLLAATSLNLAVNSISENCPFSSTAY